MTPDLTHEEMFDFNTLSLKESILYLKAKYKYDSSGDAKCIFNLIAACEKIDEHTDQQARKAFEAGRKPRVPAAVSIINNYVSYLDYDHYKNETK